MTSRFLSTLLGSDAQHTSVTSMPSFSDFSLCAGKDVEDGAQARRTGDRVWFIFVLGSGS